MHYPQYKGTATTGLVQQPDKASAARRLSLFVYPYLLCYSWDIGVQAIISEAPIRRLLEVAHDSL